MVVCHCVYYGGMSVSVLWWDVTECIIVGCQWVYYGSMSVGVIVGELK